MPREEMMSPFTSRKCSLAARPRHFSAKRFVASRVAPLMRGDFLLRFFAAAQMLLFLAVPAEPGGAHRPASFCGRARFFRERKFRLLEDCCSTSGREAKDFR